MYHLEYFGPIRESAPSSIKILIGSAVFVELHIVTITMQTDAHRPRYMLHYTLEQLASIAACSADDAG